ncbi:MAG: adenylosuccinate synthase [Candidatus Cloacimonadota bacterium]|nr:MAG: adenylosuccinate synthase [Candidatus Cloacimonadota bacterium]
MQNTVILGCMFGDEAKAKIVDIMAKDADIVVRFQGGCNAGHTIVLNSEKFIFHLVPSGILYPNKICVMANGLVIDPYELVAEMENLQNQGISMDNRLFISEQAQVTLPLHRYLDGMSEQDKDTISIGTTKRGIGPTYADKFARIGIRMADLLDKQILEKRIYNIIHSKANLLDKWVSENNVDEIIAELLNIGKILEPYITNTVYLLHDFLEQGKRLLFEGAQGALLDIDFGTYPYVTSSNTTVGGVCTGTGISPKKIGEVIGVMKSYFTRVGEGPFPTELKDEIGDLIRKRGNEYGSTTGRPRRCGWFDAVATRYTAMLNSIDSIALTLLDVLSGLDKVKICTSYQLHGKAIDYFPSFYHQLEQVKPNYIELPGWKEDISAVRKFEDLPKNAKKYVNTIEELLGIDVSIISVGPERANTIIR